MTRFVAVWRYEVETAHRAEFERTYGPDGPWVDLFNRSDQFDRTELINGSIDGQYITIDYWKSEAGFKAFMEAFRDEYEELDRHFQNLTTADQLVVRGELLG